MRILHLSPHLSTHLIKATVHYTEAVYDSQYDQVVLHKLHSLTFPLDAAEWHDALGQVQAPSPRMLHVSFADSEQPTLATLLTFIGRSNNAPHLTSLTFPWNVFISTPC